RAPAARRAAPAAPATAWATLSLNSIPISKVVLDGRPLGSTPKLSVRVKAGNHSVVFIGPGGRVARSVSVASGGSKTVAVRLPRD
ncbi:MAG: PEGA domain-containing protein, partial [Myxococcales bacterium]|nr:PEGA domain-containing protein [Myxococcales bacterium]